MNRYGFTLNGRIHMVCCPKLPTLKKKITKILKADKPYPLQIVRVTLEAVPFCVTATISMKNGEQMKDKNWQTLS